MAIFGILTDNTKEVNEFLEKTIERGKEENLLKNPFRIDIRVFPSEKQIISVFRMTPVYFNYSLFGFPPLIFILALVGLTWWLLPFAILVSLGIFWRREFYYLMSRLGLRKAGYKGKIKFVYHSRIIEECIFQNGAT